MATFRDAPGSFERELDRLKTRVSEVLPRDMNGGLVAEYRKWLHLPNVDILATILGAVAANRMSGDAVWLFVVGPPSSGKTELLNPLRDGIPESHFVADFTKAGMLTGAANGKMGGVLPSLVNPVSWFALTFRLC